MRTTCVSGLHPWDDDNTYIDTDGSRRCRPCRRASEARRRRANPKRVTHKKPRQPLPRPFAVEPLIDYVETHGSSDRTAARIHDARKDGGFTTIGADRAAIDLGTHPGLIWSNWWVDDEEAS